MITKAHRFHGRKSINFVYRRGQTVRGVHNALKYARNPRTKGYRAAVVVSRKVHKSATVRNRIRRRIYEILRLLEPNITEPYDMVFLVYSAELSQIDYAVLQADIKTQLKKAGILKDAVR